MKQQLAVANQKTKVFMSSLHLQKRGSVASNNDNVYKFINTAKKTSCIRFFVNFGILVFILFKKAGAHGAWAPEKS